MSKQTAVQWLGYELNTTLFYDITPELWEQVNEIFKQALQMERERIIHANTQGRLYNSNGESWKVEDAEYEANEWYVKTYGGKDEK